jgi:heterotetrameric sarcosine oxidase gamma subunit
MPDFKSPIAHGPVSAPDGVVRVEDETATAKIVVRASSDSSAAADLSVPFGQSRLRADGTLVCGTRPDEWTLFAAMDRAAEVAASVDTEGFVSVVDITHGRAMMRVSGPKATAVLAKVCNIDLADDMTPDGAVFSGSVANVTCDLLRSDRAGDPSYMISCERSFGNYLFAALVDASTEFGASLPAGLSIH